MQLNILTDRQIGNSVGVAASEVGDGAELAGTHHAVGNANAHHEALQRPAFPALAAGDSRSVALGVDAPPAEISSDPFWRDRLESLAGEAADFLKALPGIHRALQA